jgi:putative endonuclease
LKDLPENGVHKLVYYEQCETFDAALQREKQLIEWKRKWKLDMIEGANPFWKDLFEELKTLS